VLKVCSRGGGAGQRLSGPTLAIKVGIIDVSGIHGSPGKFPPGKFQILEGPRWYFRRIYYVTETATYSFKRNIKQLLY